MKKIEHKIMSLEDALQHAGKWRQYGEKITFTNGCFDILHAGHIDYLEKAKKLGDRLIVGVNSDASIKRFKGTHRPFQGQHSRTMVLASLQMVDLVILFNDDTPLSLITSLLPDFLVKGGDYLIENIVGAEIVLKNKGVVKTLDFIVGYSTTHIVHKIKNS